MHPSTSYDQIIYHTLPRRETHPSHLAAIASLFSVSTTPVTSCRVLELGCGTGGNIIPLAVEYPNSFFLGIDLSPTQIEVANRTVSELALKNIVFRTQSIQDFRKEKAIYDYIICHGVFSWVERNIQNQILKIFAECLSETGIAYLSYNTLPGWSMQGAIREMMRYHTALIEDPKEKVEQARALLHFISECKLESDRPYVKFVRECHKDLAKAPDYYVFHEYLEESNQAFYFNQLAERAQSFALNYVGDAHLGLMGTADIGTEANKILDELKGERIRYEQYLDFLRNRKLRESIFCKQNRSPIYPAKMAAITSLSCAAPLVPKSAIFNPASRQQEVFLHQNGGEIRTDSPILKAALVQLGEAWPESRTFAEIEQQACLISGISLSSEQIDDLRYELANGLFSYAEANLIELTSAASLCGHTIPAQPLTSALARYQAHRQESITSFRHRAVKLEAVARQVLALLDGSRSHKDLVAELTNLHAKGDLIVQAPDKELNDELLNRTLEQLVMQVLNVLVKHGFIAKTN